jgi:hypothetical protein
MTILSRIPLYGAPCHRCGYPAHHVTVVEHGRFIVHQDPGLAPCPHANPDHPNPDNSNIEPKGAAR